MTELLTRTRALALWREALASELGICIATTPDDAVSIQNLFYKVRLEAADESLSILSTHIIPDGTELWIYKRPEAYLD